MNEKRQGLSDTVLIEIIHGIKEIILVAITSKCSQVSHDRRLD